MQQKFPGLKHKANIIHDLLVSQVHSRELEPLELRASFEAGPNDLVEQNLAADFDGVGQLQIAQVRNQVDDLLDAELSNLIV